MRKRIVVPRPKRRVPKTRRMARFNVPPRPTTRSQFVTQKDWNLEKQSPARPLPYFQIDPYLDYGRFLTVEGGILIIYKDLDLRLRHTIWRLLAWTTFTVLEAAYLFYRSPIESPWLNIAALLGAAIINSLIVAKQVELYRQIEIRPDSMIVEESDVFWSRYMENGFPTCGPDREGNQVICGIYGTRFIEYLTIRRFDDYDRMPEVLSAHLQDAMRQLWMVSQ